MVEGNNEGRDKILEKEMFQLEFLRDVSCNLKEARPPFLGLAAQLPIA